MLHSLFLSILSFNINVRKNMFIFNSICAEPSVAFFPTLSERFGLAYPVYSCSPVHSFVFLESISQHNKFQYQQKKGQTKIIFNSNWCNAFCCVLSLSRLERWLGLHDMHQRVFCPFLLFPALAFFYVFAWEVLAGFVRVIVLRSFAASAHNSLACVAWLGSFQTLCIRALSSTVWFFEFMFLFSFK